MMLIAQTSLMSSSLNCQFSLSYFILPFGMILLEFWYRV